MTYLILLSLLLVTSVSAACDTNRLLACVDAYTICSEKAKSLEAMCECMGPYRQCLQVNNCLDEQTGKLLEETCMAAGCSVLQCTGDGGECDNKKAELCTGNFTECVEREQSACGCFKGITSCLNRFGCLNAEDSSSFHKACLDAKCTHAQCEVPFVQPCNATLAQQCEEAYRPCLSNGTKPCECVQRLARCYDKNFCLDRAKENLVMGLCETNDCVDGVCETSRCDRVHLGECARDVQECTASVDDPCVCYKPYFKCIEETHCFSKSTRREAIEQCERSCGAGRCGEALAAALSSPFVPRLRAVPEVRLRDRSGEGCVYAYMAPIECL